MRNCTDSGPVTIVILTMINNELQCFLWLTQTKCVVQCTCCNKTVLSHEESHWEQAVVIALYCWVLGAVSM